MIATFGLLATGLFLSGLILQIIRIHRRKMADDISQWTIAQWLLGFVLLLIVTLKTDAYWVFTFSYLTQGLVCLYLYFLVGHYHNETTLRMKRMRGKIMKEVRKSVIKGGKK